MAISASCLRLPRNPGGPLSHADALGATAIADSPDEVRLRVREQLRNGASQIKLMAGGGVSSPATSGTIQTTQYSEAELRAAVEAAADWGTYVTVHAYTPPVDPASDPRRREVHRSWPSRRRGNGPDDG